MYCASSIFFGSIRTSFNELGCILNSKLVRMVLIPTLFPEPVDPAISKCGIFDRSSANTSPAMVFPMAIGRIEPDSRNAFELMTLRTVTRERCELGISTPTADFPGIGAIMRIPRAASFRAMSFSRLTIRLILTPVAGTSS